MNYRILIIVLAALTFGFEPAASKAAPDTETIYVREVSGGRHLMVVKAEIPKEKARVDKDGKPIPTQPGAQYPEHHYEYSYIVQSADGATRQTVATQRMGTMPGEVERMKFTILEAYVDDDQLVVLCHVGRGTHGDTAFLGPRGSGFLLAADSQLVLDYRDSGTWVIGGRFEGYPKRGDLRAIVTEDVRGVTVDRRFLLVNEAGHYKWVREPAVPAKNK